MLTGYHVLWGYLPLVLAASWALFAEFLPGRDRGSAWFGAAMSALSAVLFGISQANVTLFGDKLYYATDSRLLAVGIAALAAIWMLWTADRATGRVREAVALAAFSAMGAVLMASAFDVVIMALALELASMPAYVLVGYRRNRIAGLEGAIKYFLLSVLTTLFMLYGLSFVYGLSGTTSYQGIANLADTPLSTIAVLLVLVGIFAKLSAAPFHYWAPDAYEGAEPWAVAFVATVPKIGGIAVAVRLLVALSYSSAVLPAVLAAVAIASMVLGAFAAISQADIRRMMAYSSVVNSGYMLIPLATLTATSAAGTGALTSSSATIATTLYVVIYAFATMAVMLIVASEGGRIVDVAGLVKRRPAAAWGLAIALLSLIGVPPMAGFFGKFYLFMVGVMGGQLIAVVVATVVSVVSAFYYLRIVKSAFFGVGEEDLAPAAPRTWGGAAAIAIAVVVTVGLGPASGIVMNWMGSL